MFKLIELCFGALFVWSLIGGEWLSAVICLVMAAFVRALRVRLLRRRLERATMQRIPSATDMILWEEQQRLRQEGRWPPDEKGV